MRRLWSAAAAGLAVTGLLLTACTASPAVSTAASVQPGSAPPGGTADCDSVTTCYTPGQFQVAYGIKPLLDRGIDGRGETVVLPELAEPALNEPLVSNMRQDMTRFDQVFGLAAARLRVNTSLAGRVAHRHLDFVNPALYRIAASPTYHRASHDITSGNNTAKFPPKTFTGYRAASGWDPVTGLGCPDAQWLVPLLAASPSANPTFTERQCPVAARCPGSGLLLAGGNCRWRWVGSN